MQYEPFGASEQVGSLRSLGWLDSRIMMIHMSFLMRTLSHFAGDEVTRQRVAVEDWCFGTLCSAFRFVFVGLS